MSDIAAIEWRTASASAGGECVEVAFHNGAVLVRHSKDPGGAVLRYSDREWRAFIVGVKNGEFAAPEPTPEPI